MSSRIPTWFLELAPDLAVEVVSPWDRWTTVGGKVDAYLAAGVRAVWVVEPGPRTVRVYALEGSEQRLYADRADVLRAEAILPGCQLPLAELLI